LQVDDLLFELGDALLQGVHVDRGADACLAPGVVAEQFGQPLLKAPDLGGLAGDLAVCIGEVGLQRGSADRRGARAGRVGLGGVESG
jgi:hypothetical protein